MRSFRLLVCAFIASSCETTSGLTGGDDDAGTSGGDTHLWPEINGRIAGGLADELDHFVTATLTRKPYLQHYREAYDAIPVLDALAASVQGGQPVDVAR